MRNSDSLKKSNRSHWIPEIFLAVLPFVTGLYFEWAVFLSLIALVIALCGICFRNGQIDLWLSPELLVLALIFAGAVISTLVAPVHGKAVYGIFRAMGPILLAVLFMQTGRGSDRLRLLPWSGLAMLVASVILYLIPPTREIVFMDGRLIGPMGYANVTAFYFLFCLILETEHPIFHGMRGEKIFGWSLPVAMVFGILWTGSRMTALLLIPVWIWVLATKEDLRKRYLILLLILCIGILTVLARFGNQSIFTRFTKVFSDTYSNSTRLIYWSDGIRQILRHPLGQGYQSFYDLQGTFQGANYNVRFLHNSFLEIFFSYGWIAGLSMIFLLVREIPRTRGARRLILILLTIRCLEDFDFQFLSLVYISIACMGWKHGAKRTIPLGRNMANSSDGTAARSFFGVAYGALITIFSLWLGIASLMDYAGKPELAARIYPWNWEYQRELMNRSSDGKDQSHYAKRVLQRNSYSADAWTMLGNIAYRREDYEEAFTDYMKAVERRHCDGSLYEGVLTAAEMYRQASPGRGKEIIENLEKLRTIVHNAERTASERGKDLALLPDFTAVDQKITEMEGSL